MIILFDNFDNIVLFELYRCRIYHFDDLNLDISCLSLISFNKHPKI